MKYADGQEVVIGDTAEAVKFGRPRKIVALNSLTPWLETVVSACPDGSWGWDYACNLRLLRRAEMPPYASGETPEVGDLIESVNFNFRTTVKKLHANESGFSAGAFRLDVGYCYPRHYRLISRGWEPPAAPVPPSPRVDKESYDSAIEERDEAIKARDKAQAARSEALEAQSRAESRARHLETALDMLGYRMESKGNAVVVFPKAAQ